MPTYYPQLLASRILRDSDRSSISLADNGSVVGYQKANKLIIATQIGYNNRDTAPSSYKLQWRNYTDAGAFADVASTGECKWSTTSGVLVDGTAVTSATSRCTFRSDQSWQNGIENLGDNLLPDVGTLNLASDCYTELQWGLDLADAQEGHIYEWRLWNNTSGLATGTCLCLVTVANNYSLSCAAGSFAKTGSAVTLKKGYPIQALPGSFVKTGTAVTLKRAGHIDPASGDYDATGMDATPKRRGKVVAAAGDFDETGSIVGLIHNVGGGSPYSISAGAGAVTVTGYDTGTGGGWFTTGWFSTGWFAAGVPAGYNMVAASGAFVLDCPGGWFESDWYGADGWFEDAAADLDYVGWTHYSLSCAAGTFTETGTAASLKRTAKITAGAGSIIWTGASTIQPLTGYYIEAGGGWFYSEWFQDPWFVTDAVGVFAVTGSAVSLRKGKILSADAGSVAASEGEETLLYRSEVGVTIIGAHGEIYVQEGFDVRLLHSRIFDVSGAGEYTLTGQDVTFDRGGKIAASAGAFVETGTAVGLRTTNILSAGAGAFVVDAPLTRLIYSLLDVTQAKRIVASPDLRIVETTSQQRAARIVSTPSERRRKMAA